MNVSVVIPAYNEEKRIGRCLDSLCAQVTTAPFEVIVVDNNSTDNTADIINSFKDRLTVRVVFEPRRNRGAARKAGSREAKGDIILSTDADTIVPPHWIQHFVDTFTMLPHIKGIAGVTKISDCSPLNTILSNGYMAMAPYFLRLWYGHHVFAGTNSGVRRDAYEAVGGYSAELDAQEDIELSQRIMKLGDIILIRSAPVLSSGRRFRGGFLRGWWAYISTYIKQFWFDEQGVRLSNPK
jgi:glycosyltransferase involved in cell wall biosynthesis